MSVRAVIIVALVCTAALCGCRTPGTVGRGDGSDAPALTPAELRAAGALAHYYRGLVTSDSSDTNQLSDTEFERAFECDPGNNRLAATLARRYHGQERITDAARVLDIARRHNPEDYDIALFLAITYQMAEQYDRALHEYLRLIHLDPARGEGYAGAAQMHVATERDDKALAAISEGLKKADNPQNIVELCRRLGHGYTGAGQLHRAARCFNMIRSAEPDDVRPTVALVQIYLTMKDSKRALLTARQAPARFQDSPMFHHVMAKLFVDSGNFRDALGFFEATERTQKAAGVPEDEVLNHMFYYDYGMACERTRQLKKAEECFEKSIALNAIHNESFNYLAYMWAEQGVKLEQALDYVNKALKTDPDNPAYIDTLGWIYYKQNRLDLALQEISKAHALMPDEPVIADHLGDVFAATSEPEKAVAQWKKSFMLDPDNKAVAAKLAEHGLNVGRLRRAAMTALKIRQQAIVAAEDAEPNGEEE